MKLASFTATLLITNLLVMPSFAYVKTGLERMDAPNRSIKEAKKEGFGTLWSETAIKKDLLKLQKKDSKKFNSILSDQATPEDYKGYAYEVRDGASQVEQAKTIAKLAVLKAARNDKKFFMESSANTEASDNWKATEYYLKRKINEGTVYMPSRLRNGNFQFQVSDIARVSVDKSLRVARYTLDVSSSADDNRLDPIAPKIKIQNDPSSNQYEESSPREEPVIQPLAGSSGSSPEGTRPAAPRGTRLPKFPPPIGN